MCVTNLLFNSYYEGLHPTEGASSFQVSFRQVRLTIAHDMDENDE